MRDMNRVAYVTLRSFMFLMFFVTLKLAYWQNLKEKGQRTVRKSGKNYYLQEVYL